MDLKNTQNKQNKQYTKKSKKHFLHDHFFKEVYSQPKYCVDILSLVLSEKEMSLFDWNTLGTETTTFIDQSAREKRMDLLVSALLKDSKRPAKILFLMEHKSKKDPELLRQFLMYQAGIYQRKKDPVLPVFINQSQNKTWKEPLDFHGFLDNFTGELKQSFKENVLNFRPRVLNIQALDMDEAQGLTTRPILYILKHIWKLDEQKIKGLFTIGRGLSREERENLIKTAVDYMRRYDPCFAWDIVEEIETQTVGKGEAIMTPALRSSLEEEREKGLLQGKQEGRMEGIQKGLLQGKQEGRVEGIQKGLLQGMQKGRTEGKMEGRMERDKEVIAKMLKKNLQISVISEVTGLSRAQIKKLQNGSSRRNSK